MPKPDPSVTPVALKVQFADVYYAAVTQGTFPAAVMTWAALSPANTAMLSDVIVMGKNGSLPQYPGLLQIVVDAVNRS